jgi:hypothetical protein
MAKNKERWRQPVQDPHGFSEKIATLRKEREAKLAQAKAIGRKPKQ